jgi:hypothetical protein
MNPELVERIRIVSVSCSMTLNNCLMAEAN